MRTPNANRSIATASLTLLLAFSSAHAEIYKWVDEKGRTHYSETRPDTAKAKAVDVRPAPQAAQQLAPEAAAMPSWQEQERRLRQRQAEEAVEKASRRPEPVRSLSRGRADGTDASRCALARDMINGTLRHSNGAPIDQNDIDVARSDIRNFCR